MNKAQIYKGKASALYDNTNIFTDIYNNIIRGVERSKHGLPLNCTKLGFMAGSAKVYYPRAY